MILWRIERLAAHSPFYGDWEKMRVELWPDSDPGENERECREMSNQPERLPVFVALGPAGEAVGFAEAQLRDYAEGCDSSPVGYLEGWYVRNGWRRRGIGRALVAAVEDWARSRGVTEMASDTDLTNLESERAHKALGFEEAERIICFRKPLTSVPGYFHH
jgi:aminoglycoside 6'-N-acetyltransferase I